MANGSPLDRLKVYINSSSSLVIMETIEEQRALDLVRLAASDLQLTVFEWSVADGLRRYEAKPNRPIPSGHYAVQDFLAPITQNEINIASGAGSIMNTQEPAVYILKDFHRHIEDAVVARRLREVAQEFSAKHCTLVITAPSIALPPELRAEAEFLDLPLPDRTRLKQIVEETFQQLSKRLTLKRKTSPADLEAMAGNLCGLTEEEAERAVANAVVSRYALGPEVVTDVLEAKKEMLRRSGMLEFIDVEENLSSIGGLENLKKWLGRRAGTWEDSARAAGRDVAKACAPAPSPANGSCRW